MVANSSITISHTAQHVILYTLSYVYSQICEKNVQVQPVLSI